LAGICVAMVGVVLWVPGEDGVMGGGQRVCALYGL